MRPLPSVVVCPSGTPDGASARLRGHGLARELARLGCSVQVGADARGLPDLLFVQKCNSPAIVDLARRVRAGGGLVVFDIDDWGNALPASVRDAPLLAALLAECAVISTDTDQRATQLRADPAYAGVGLLWVLPDPVDYVADAPPAPSSQALPTVAGQAAARLAGCWFGNGPNLAPALPFVQAALATDRLGRFGVITNAQFVAQLQQAMPVLSVEAWQLETFAARLRAHDFCLLVHDSNTEGLQKSNNKMLAALGQGVLPLVSNTPAYAETARLIGIPELVLDSPADLASRLDAGVIAALRQRIQGSACQQLLHATLPATVAQGFLARLQALRRAAPAAAAQTGGTAMPIRLNLGCGDMLLPGYVNVDVAAERRGRQPDVVCDIRDLSAFPDNHADEVMAIHVIEHFYRWEVVDLIKEWVRVLKPGGQLVLECPNLLSACEALLANPEQAAQPGQAGSRSMWCFYGDPSWQDPLMCHRWLYTPQSLAQVMHEAGLRELAQKPPQFKARHPRDMRVVGRKPVLPA